MINIELYEEERPLAVIEHSEGEDFGAWARLQEALTRGIVGGGPRRFEVRIDVLMAELEVLREIRRTYRTQLVLGPTLQAQLQQLAADRKQLEAAIEEPPGDAQILSEELRDIGFKRVLKPFQLQNLSKISVLPHAADFSVPGAGKTTVALASYAIQRARGRMRRLLVVAPLAAFATWKEDSAECFVDPPIVGVHLGPGTPILKTAELVLTNYHRLAADYDRLRAWVSIEPTQIVLDEAHHVKRGRGGVHGRAALDLSYPAARRDILTGTPAPQGAHDLVALVRFLYPGQARQILPSESFVERLGRDPVVLNATHQRIKRYFVRTCKSDLDLPPTTRATVRRPMGPVQAAVYAALAGRYCGHLKLPTSDRRRMRDLGRIVMYLLEAATNPLLLLAGSDTNDLPAFDHPPLELSGDEHVADLLRRYGEYERPWKYEFVQESVTEAAERGEKVVVWSNFVRNLKFLARELAPWHPAIVHGGIPPEDGAPSHVATTRERELDRFRNDGQCAVLLANPAACGEGISLHHWCHHAIYLDRTFNAGHFLQSQDRIHRLGLAAETVTKFTMLMSEGSIDGSVDQRLREKLTALSVLMNDPGLVQVALPDEEGEVGGEPAFEDDVAVLSKHLTEVAT